MQSRNKKKVIEHYNTLGERIYDLRYTDEQQEKYNLILTEIGKMDLLLDNGCGTGLLFPLVDIDLIGIDISYALLEKAKKRKKENQHLINCDSEFLPLKHSVFDSAISVTVIQNIGSPEKFIAETIRVVKPKSLIIITSLKRVYSRKKICKMLETTQLFVKKIFTNEKLNDWITISIKNGNVSQ